MRVGLHLQAYHSLLKSRSATAPMITSIKRGRSVASATLNDVEKRQKKSGESSNSASAGDSPSRELVLHQYAAVVKGGLERRYKRFLGDVLLDGDSTATVVHVPNTGPMLSLLDCLPAPAVLSVSTVASRKYAHTLEWLQPGPGQAWVGVHSAKANVMVRALLESGELKSVLPYVGLRAEVRYGKENSRVDFVLEKDGGAECYTEVKSVSLAEQTDEGDTIALFPDTVSVRAQRHLRELTALTKAGGCAALVFLVQRGDCSAFAPCYDKDPAYGLLLKEAVAAGVQVVPVACEIDLESAKVLYKGTLPLNLGYKEPL